MPYLPHSADDVRRALETVGIDSIDALFDELPGTLRNPDIELPPAMDETTLMAHLRALAARDEAGGPNFLGGGMRRHFIPAVTPHLALQSEFVTAYTPYQPEVAQGILQATFEFQTMMCELTGLDVANASMYDGATAVAEAALLAVRQTRRNTVLVSRGVHPEARAVLTTYLRAQGIVVRTLDLEGGRTPADATESDAACVIAQQPNHVGLLEDMAAIGEAAHRGGALLVAVVDPLSLALLRPPGAYGADVAVGDGQTLGNPMAFGGPSFGFMVVRQELLRQLPGRLVGQTTDVEGRRAYVLTLQAREQHIRRSKAKSNICSNHQLTALMATVNMAALGPEGLREMAVGSVRQAHRLADRLRAEGARLPLEGRFFNEFPMATRRPAGALRSALAQRGVHAGVPLGSEYGLGEAFLLSATELVTDDDIEALTAALRAEGELQASEVHHA